jgi:hypothetical protein
MEAVLIIPAKCEVSRIRFSMSQASLDLFLTTRCTTRPEMDEFVFSLPEVNSDTNRLMRHSGNEGYEPMGTFLVLMFVVHVKIIRFTRKHALVIGSKGKVTKNCNHGRY